MALPFSVSLTIVRKSVDRYGDTTANSTHNIDGCVVWPVSTTEVGGNQDVVTWQYIAIVPVDSDVLATDDVLYLGDSYSIVGHPTSWRSVFTGKQPGIELHLTAVTG